MKHQKNFDEEYISIIKDSTKSLNTQLVWNLTAVALLTLSIFKNEGIIKVGEFMFPLKGAGLYLATLFFILDFQITKTFVNIVSLFKKIEIDNNIIKAKIFLNNYSGILNPFSETTNNHRKHIVDHIGYAVYSFQSLWGYYLTFRLIKGSSLLILSIYFFVVLISVLFHFDRTLLIQHSIFTICPNTEKIKRYVSLISIIIIWTIIIVIE